MTTNKNQHFVPRSYLRPFTLDEGNAAINVFNLDHSRFFHNAPLKNQCSGDYFYGKDELLESAIRFVESSYAKVLRDLRAPKAIMNEEHKTVLRRFWLLQHLRTEAASRRSVEMATEFDTVAGGETMSYKLGIKTAVLLAMRSYADMMTAVDDVKVCLIRNRTKIPFITSDDPAILTNRWYLEDKRIFGRSFGLRSSGLLGLLPLSPHLMLVAYDGDVYQIAHEHGFSETRRVEDVRAFNQHQILNCFANVYLKDRAHSDELLSQVQTILPLRLKSRHAVHVAVEDKTVGNYTRYRIVAPAEAHRSEESVIMHSEMLHCKPTAWPAVVRWRVPGAVYTNGTGIKYIRKECAAVTHSHRDSLARGCAMRLNPSLKFT